MAPISYFNKAKIVGLLQLGYSESRTAAELNIAKSSVNFVSRIWRERGSIERKIGSGRPRSSNEEEDHALLQAIENDPFLTAIEGMINTNFPASVHTARRRLKKNDLKNYVASKKFKLTAARKEVRIGFALEHILRENNYWHRVVFSDEKVFQRTPNGRFRVYRPRNQRYNSKYIKKQDPNRFSVNMWSWMCASSRGVLLHVEERLNSENYIRILENVMLPSVRPVLQENFIYQHDNCPIHKAHRVQQWMLDHNITVLDWPSYSPDINPIENVWAKIVQNIRKRRIIPQNREELLQLINSAWLEIPNEYFERLCDSMPRRLDKVIIANGELTKY